MEQDKIMGFRLVEADEIAEIASEARLYEHEKTGARLLVLANDDANKVFGIGFRTPPEDGTGVAHIVEHCVLSGSRRYRTKEPFMDLYASSLQTFLNAMTYPDKTIYPVASRNAKDFANLVDVYLDAVFYPRIYEDPRIFAQEGWHYELDAVDGELSYRGVVYNEMKGAYSDPNTVLRYAVSQTLLPDTPYAMESGGNPEQIPSLSYEAFLDFHRRFYHPSNAYLFLYGDMDVEYWLDYLDREWLADFERQDPNSAIAEAPRFEAPVVARTSYPSDPADTGDSQDYIAWAAATGAGLGPRDRVLLALIADLLFSSQSARVRDALLKSGLCSDVRTLAWDAAQGVIGIAGIEAKPELAERMESLVRTALEEELAEGLDPARVEAALNRLEYDLRECEGYPTRGIIYFIRAFDLWLYDGDPLEMLRFDGLFAELRAGIADGEVERYARALLLDNPHRCVVHMEADPELGAARETALAEALAATLEGMSEEARAALVAETRALIEWQTTPDTPEARATIPALELDDVERALTAPPLQLNWRGRGLVAEQTVFSSGIHYLRIAWSLADFELDDLPYIDLVASLIGFMDTSARSYRELDTEIYLVTGGVSLSPSVFVDPEDPTRLDVRIVLSTKCTAAQVERLPALLQELLQETRFEDRGRLRELLAMARTRAEMGLVNAGSNYAAQRARSYFQPAAAIADRLSGFDAFASLNRLLAMLDREADAEQLVERLTAVYRRLFASPDWLLSVTGDEGATGTVVDALLPLLPPSEDEPREGWTPDEARAFVPVDWQPMLERRNEGFGSTSTVQYVAQSFELADGGLSYDGRAQVIATWLSLGFLHNEIRAQGGAYGSSLRIQRSGGVDASSYRDPHLGRTFEVFNRMPDALEAFVPERAELDRLIIATVNRFDPPMTPESHAGRNVAELITGLDALDREQSLGEALETQPEDFARFAEPFRRGLARQNICVVGGLGRITEEAERFGEVLRLRGLGLDESAAHIEDED